MIPSRIASEVGISSAYLGMILHVSNRRFPLALEYLDVRSLLQIQCPEGVSTRQPFAGVADAALGCSGLKIHQKTSFAFARPFAPL